MKTHKRAAEYKAMLQSRSERDDQQGETPEALRPLLRILKQARRFNDEGSSFDCGMEIDSAIEEISNFKETQLP